MLRIFFRLLYHPLAWAYDSVAAIVSVGLWQSWVASVIPYLPGPKVLELGHGPGHLQAHLLAENRLAYGVDESRQMVWLARRRLLRRGFTPRLTRGMAQALPYPAGTFQQIVATFPSEYIADPQTLMEIYRVLASEGEAVLLLLAWITGKHWYARLAAWLFRVTGQAPAGWDERNLDLFQRIGFQSKSELISLKTSRLLIVRLRKPANDH